MKACISCGFCCRKSICWRGKIETLGGRCIYLYWNKEKWRCKLIESDPVAAKDLAAGEGCCASLNTYRVCGVVPSPDDLMMESVFLRKIQKEKSWVVR